MSTKLFVSNLDFEVDKKILTDIFNEVAECKDITIAFDKRTNKSRGFAFIEMNSADDAKKAVKVLNEKAINGRSMKVSFDKGKKSSEPSAGKKKEFLPPMQKIVLFTNKGRTKDRFTESETLPNYKDPEVLAKYLSETGKIQSRRVTGFPAKIQRRYKKAVKRAQNLGLIAFSK